MNKIIIVFSLFLPTLIFGQSSKDINTVIQKTIDLHALKNHFNELEKSGETPLIILNDDKIPNNLIVFKFNKRVKIMTPQQLEAFQAITKKNLDSYFVFELINFTNNAVKIKAKFRKVNTVEILVNMKKQNQQWMVSESSAS